MTALLTLLASSAAGTLTWLAVRVARPLTQGRFSQAWHYRVMLIPVFFLLGGSVLLTPAFQAARSMLPKPSENAAAESNSAVYAPNVIPALDGQASTQPSDATGGRNMIDQKELTALSLIVWAAGAAVFFTIKATGHHAFKKSILKNSQPFPRLDIPVKIIISQQVVTPMLVGVIKPFIALPAAPFTVEELELVLAHELSHLRQGDLFIKLAALIAGGLHWFNPAAYFIRRDLDTYCECYCDERLVRGMETRQRRLYGQTILNALEYGARLRNGVHTGFAEPQKQIKRRLVNIIHYKKISRRAVMLSVAVMMVLLVIGGVAACSVLEPSQTPAQTAETPWYEDLRSMIAAEKIYIDGELVEGFPAFFTRSVALEGDLLDYIMVPLLAVAEKCGLETKWDAETQTAWIDGVAVRNMEKPEGVSFGTPVLFADYLYVGPNFFNELFGIEPDWSFDGVIEESFGNQLSLKYKKYEE